MALKLQIAGISLYMGVAAILLRISNLLLCDVKWAVPP